MKVKLNKIGEEKIEVKIDGELFTNYYYSKEYIRPFLHPVIGPYGESVTRNYPIIKDIPGETTDHIHHRSIWVAHGDVNGVDDWSEEEGCGRITQKKFINISEGECGIISSENSWVDSSGKKILKEEREIKIIPLQDKEKFIDFEITFFAENSDIIFGDTKEAGIISVRVATCLDGDKSGRIENSEGGIFEKETWGERAKWCDYSGISAGEKVGICIFDHPENLRYPTYWHVRDYGLMAANCFAISQYKGNKGKEGNYTLKKGGNLKFEYRIYIHKGDAKEANIEEKYQDYIKE